jgi:hypothetical protein
MWKFLFWKNKRTAGRECLFEEISTKELRMKNDWVVECCLKKFPQRLRMKKISGDRERIKTGVET